jgi:hypothetical protein
MKKAALSKLLAGLAELLKQLAEDETPKPKPPPLSPRRDEGKPIMRQAVMSGKLEVWNGETWVPAHFIPDDYRPDGQGGYWKRLERPRHTEPGPWGRR